MSNGGQMSGIAAAHFQESLARPQTGEHPIVNLIPDARFVAGAGGSQARPLPFSFPERDIGQLGFHRRDRKIEMWSTVQGQGVAVPVGLEGNIVVTETI